METSEIQSPPKFFSGYVPQTRDFALHTRGFTPAPIVGFLFGFGGAYFIARCIHLDAGSDVVEVSLAPIWSENLMWLRDNIQIAQLFLAPVDWVKSTQVASRLSIKEFFRP